MGYIPDATIAAFKGIYNLGLFFRLDTSPALHLWWGVSDKPAQIDDLDVSGTVYNGAGLMTDVPDALELLINGTASRVDWEMSGVPPALTAELANTAPSVVGARVDFAIGALDVRWQLIGSPISAWVGTADFWAEAQSPQSDIGKPKLRKIILSTMAGDTSRALPYFATWTDRDQLSISATDTFCERVPRYYTGQIITWPRF